MRVLVVYCHPNEASFASTLHQTVLKALQSRGHEVTDLDLYADGFRPVMSREERQQYEDPVQYRETVEKYALQLAEAEAIVAVYPTWWYGLPAMRKGYFDRVWAPGIAFDIGADGVFQTDRLDNIRKLGVVTTYGSPWWLIRLCMGDPERKLWGRAIRKLCSKGCTLDWHAHYNMDSSPPERLEQGEGVNAVLGYANSSSRLAASDRSGWFPPRGLRVRFRSATAGFDALPRTAGTGATSSLTRLLAKAH